MGNKKKKQSKLWIWVTFTSHNICFDVYFSFSSWLLPLPPPTLANINADPMRWKQWKKTCESCCISAQPSVVVVSLSNNGLFHDFMSVPKMEIMHTPLASTIAQDFYFYIFAVAFWVFSRMSSLLKSNFAVSAPYERLFVSLLWNSF